MSVIRGVKELAEDAIAWQNGATGNLTRTLEVRLNTGERYGGRVAMSEDKYITVNRVTGYREHVRYYIPFANIKLIKRYETSE